jgi:hypothetical protein
VRRVQLMSSSSLAIWIQFIYCMSNFAAATFCDPNLRLLSNKSLNLDTSNEHTVPWNRTLTIQREVLLLQEGAHTEPVVSLQVARLVGNCTNIPARLGSWTLR